MANKDFKKQLVLEGKTHAALVFEGDKAVGWCQFGSPAELPNIYHKKEYEKDQKILPAYRLTCIFVDKDHRKQGVARAAVEGALAIIAKHGGGSVEAYPQDAKGKTISSSFLYNGTRGLFENVGFTYIRPKGKNHCVMKKEVDSKVPI